jgi:hypothetical protein
VTSGEWTAEDRQRFADRNILKASSVPGKHFDGPTVDDWGGTGDWGADADLPVVASCDLENPESCESCT